MANYYLRDSNANQKAKIVSVMTSSLGYDNGTYYGLHLGTYFATDFSPDGQHFVQVSRNSATAGDWSFIIHQSQSNIVGGFNLAGTASNSAVFTSAFTEDADGGDTNRRPAVKFLNNNEIVVLGNCYHISSSHSFSGSGVSGKHIGRKGGDLANSTGGQGVFFILSGSGANWEVTFVASGSTLNITDGIEQPYYLYTHDSIAINYKYSTKETDMIATYANYRYYQNDNPSVNVFKKVSGSWGWHTAFFANKDSSQMHTTTNGQHINELEFFGEEQRDIIVNSTDAGVRVYIPATGSTPKDVIRYNSFGTSAGAYSGMAWDPYNKRFYGQYLGKLYIFNTSSTLRQDVLNKDNADETYGMHGTYPNYSDTQGNTPALQFRFRSGSAGIVTTYLWTDTTGRAMTWAESGSLGWMGFIGNSNNNMKALYPKFFISNSGSTAWPGGDKLRMVTSSASPGIPGYIQLANNTAAQHGWLWNTTKGASGDLLWALETKGGATDNTGRSYFLRFGVYDGQSVEGFNSIKTGSASYSVSSSVASGLNWTYVPAHAGVIQGATSLNYHIGGVISPDGTKVAVSSYYDPNGSYRRGTEIWKSGSSGWEFEAFLSGGIPGSSLARAVDILWWSNSEVWCTYGGSQAPRKFVSSSAGGWDGDGAFIIDTSSTYYNDGTSISYSYTRNPYRMYPTPDKSLVIFASHLNKSIFIVPSASASPSQQLTSSFYNNRSYTTAYRNFGFAGKDTLGRWKVFFNLIGTNTNYNGLYQASIDPTTGKDTAALLEGLTTGATPRLHFANSSDYDQNGQIMLYNSASDTLIYGHGPDEFPNLIEMKMNPYGDFFHKDQYHDDVGLSGSAFQVPFIAHPNTRSTYEPWGFPTNMATAQWPMSGSPISSIYGQEGNGLVSTLPKDGRNFDSFGEGFQLRAFADPSGAERYFFLTEDSLTSSPTRIKCIEKGSDGWKYTLVSDHFTGSVFKNSGNFTDTAFSISETGRFVMPNPSGSGFAVVDLIPQDPPRSSTASTAITAASGGTVSAGGTQASPKVTVTFGANVLASDTTVTASVVTDSTTKFNNLLAIKTQAGSSGAEWVSDIIRIEPHGQLMKRGATATVQFELDSVPDDLSIWKRDSHEGGYTQWYQIPDNLWSRSGTTITINTSRFSEYGGIGGIGMARTKLNNTQLVTLTTTDLVDSSAIRISGSNTGRGVTIAGDDLLLLESGGATYHVSASQLAGFFGGAFDVSGSLSDNEEYRISFVDPSDNTQVGLGADSDLTWNPSTNTLTVAGAGGITASAGPISGSGNLAIAGAAYIAGQLSASSLVGDGSGLTGVGASVANEAASSDDHFVTFVAATSSAASFFVESGSLKYNPSANQLKVDNINSIGGTLNLGTTGDGHKIIVDSSKVAFNTPSGTGNTIEFHNNGFKAGEVETYTDSGNPAVFKIKTSTILGLSGSSTVVSGSGGLKVFEGPISGSGAMTLAGAITGSGGAKISGGLVDIDAAVDIDVPSNQTFAVNTDGSGGDINLTAGSGGDIVLSTNGGGFFKVDASTDISIGSVNGTPKLGRSGTTTQVLGPLSGSQGMDMAGTADFGGAVNIQGLLSGSGGMDLAGTADFGGAVNVQGTLTVTGDLNVQGTTTTVDTANLLVEDPLIQLGSSSAGNAAADGDRGLVLSLSGSNNKAVFWDNSESQFAFVDTTSTGADTTITVSSYASMRALAITASVVSASTFVGDGSGISGVAASITDAATNDLDLQVMFTSGAASAATMFVNSGSLMYNPSLNALKASRFMASGSETLVLGAAYTTSDAHRININSSALVFNTPSGTGQSVEFHNNGFKAGEIEVYSDSGVAHTMLMKTTARLALSGGLGVAVSGNLGLKVLDGPISGSGALTLAGAITGSGGAKISGGLVDIDAAVDVDVPSGQTFAVTTDGSGGDINLTAGSGGDIVLSTNGGGFASIDASTNITIGGTNGTPKLGRSGTTTQVLGALSGAADLTIAGDVYFMSGSDLTVDSSDSTHFFLVTDSDDNQVRRESITDFVQHITGAAGNLGGIRVSSGKLYIAEKEEVFVSSSMTAGLTASIANGPVLSGSLMVFLNGLLQTRSGSANAISVFDYRLDSYTAPTQILMADSLDSDDVLVVRYIQK